MVVETFLIAARQVLDELELTRAVTLSLSKGLHAPSQMIQKKSGQVDKPELTRAREVTSSSSRSGGSPFSYDANPMLEEEPK